MTHRVRTGQYRIEALEDRRLMAVGAELVLDLGIQELGSNARDFVEAGGLTYFLADDGYQTGLWVTNGTSAGTRKATELMPSPVVDIGDLVAADDRLFYVVNDSGVGTDLLIVADPIASTSKIVSLPDHGQLSSLTALEHGVLIAVDIDGAHPVYATDGTAAGTFELDARATSQLWDAPILSPEGSFFWRVVQQDGSVDFWRTDATEGGTQIVATFTSDDEFADDRFFDADLGGLYFVNVSSQRQQGLVRYDLEDGSVNRILGDSWTPINIGHLGSTMIISAEGDAGQVWLWRSDGTEAGSEPLGQVTSTSGSAALEFAEMGGALYFVSNTLGVGSALWRTDGTVPGTFAVAEIATGAGSNGSIAASSDRVLVATNPELWTSDGTKKGTFSLDLALAEDRTLTALGGRVYFNGADEQLGSEPWLTDGTPTGTGLLLNVNASNEGFPSANAPIFDDHGGIYFNRYTEEGEGQIWRMELATGKSTLVWEVDESGPRPEGFLAVVDDRVIFRNWLHGVWAIDAATGTASQLLYPLLNLYNIYGVQDGHFYFGDGEYQIWATDGTSEGTYAVADGPDIEGLWNAGGRTYFREDFKLYVTDGTESGTHLLREDVDAVSSDQQFVDFNGAVYFNSSTGLWKTDGTPEGTTRVVDAPVDPTSLKVVGDKMMFVAWSDNAYRIWTSDGTVTGTAPVEGSAIRSDPQDRRLISIGDLAIFANSDDDHGGELWVSDGTSAGTNMLMDVNPGPGGSGIRDIKVVRGTGFFSAYDPEHGYEPWMTDGTLAGTRRIADVKPGAGSSLPNAFTESAGQVYFLASDGVHGEEFWRVTSPAGDADFDGVVDGNDLDAVRGTFGASGETARGDVDGNGQVDLNDLNLVRNHFGTTSASAVSPQLTRRIAADDLSSRRTAASDAVFAMLTAAEPKNSTRRK